MAKQTKDNKKSVKSLQHSAEFVTPTKMYVVEEEELNPYTRERTWVTRDQKIEKGYQILREACDDSKNYLLMTQIYRAVGLSQVTAAKYRQQLPEFKECIENAKLALGDRRYVGSAIRNPETGRTPLEGSRLETPWGHFNHPDLKEAFKEDKQEEKLFDFNLTERLERLKSDLRKDLMNDISEVLVKMLEVPKKVKDG